MAMKSISGFVTISACGIKPASTAGRCGREKKSSEAKQRDRHDEHGRRSLRSAEAFILKEKNHHHIDRGDEAAPDQRDAEEQLEPDRGADDFGQIARGDGDLAEDPEENHGRLRIVIAAGLREVAAGRDAELHAEMLEQDRHQVRDQDDGEQRVAKLRAAGEIGGPVSRVHVADRDEKAGSGKGRELAPERGVSRDGDAPGFALELGSGQGADAIWLARAGWTVLAVELSATALRLADGRAREAGVSDRIEWRRHDLGSGVPDGAFDLVLSSYTQSPVALDRVEVLRHAAARVAPGGTLLIVGHSGVPSWSTDHTHAADMPDAATLIAQLDLPEDEWAVDRRLDVERAITDPDGAPATRQDSVVRLRRR